MSLDRKHADRTRVGVEWSDDLQAEIVDRLGELSCLELIPENFFDNRRPDFLQALAKANTPVLVHAVEMSIGTTGEFKKEHFEKCKQVLEQVNTVNFSDHLCMTEADGIEIGQLTPIPWTKESVDVVCRNIDRIQSEIKVPFLIENITNRFLIPDNEMSETDFINTITRRTGCKLLLDVTNVYTNGLNFKFDPYEWIEQIDSQSIEGIHLAGGYFDKDGALVDSHSRNVFPEVWDIFRFVLSRSNPSDVIVEWTDECPPLETVMGDIHKAKDIIREVHEMPSLAYEQNESVVMESAL